MEQKLNIIWTDLNDYLKGFIFKQVRDSHITDDILQDVYIKVNLKIKTLKDESKLTSWIFQITRNAVNDYYRSNKRKFDSDFNFELADNIVIQDETQKLVRCINPMIESLPEKYREAIKLSEIEGLSQKELAKHLNISYSGAKSRVQRGREQLKGLLLQCCTIKSDKYGNILKHEEKSCSGKC